MVQGNLILIFSTELQNLKPYGEISITLDDNNVWIYLNHPHTHVYGTYNIIVAILEVTFISFFCRNQLDKFPDVSFPIAPPNCISDTAKAFLGTVMLKY